MLRHEYVVATDHIDPLNQLKAPHRTRGNEKCPLVYTLVAIVEYEKIER
jgi:hypothetical protein